MPTLLLTLNPFLTECFSSGQTEEILMKYNLHSKPGTQTQLLHLFERLIHILHFRYAITLWYFDAKEKDEARVKLRES
jgi:hypothetical protein